MTKFNTAEALVYLRKKTGVEIKADAFYHRVRRGGIPYTVTSVGRKKRYEFSPEDLDKITFRPRSLFQLPTGFTPVTVRSDEDLQALHKKFGRVVELHGLLAELESLTGHRYHSGAIKQRRRRGTIIYVGISGSPTRPTYWYPVSQLKYLNLQPRLDKV